MSKREEEYANKLIELTNKFKHPLLSSLIKAIANDSYKHAMFYNAMAELLSGRQPVVTEEEFKTIAEGIEEHIITEKDMIEFTGKLLNETKDPRLKLILAAIHEDEIKHHKLLISIKDNIAEYGKFGEEELWDAVWKDSPWHGSPGG